MLHYLLSLHKQIDRLHRDALVANKLEAFSFVFPFGCIESLGRQISVQCRLRLHLSLLCHWRDQQTWIEVLRTYTVNSNLSLCLYRYNVTVKSNLYAKYYFELRALFKDNEKEFPLKPLDKADAINLELNSVKYKNTLET